MVSEKSALELHSELLTELAQILFQQAEIASPEWDDAFHDFRAHPRDSGMERTVVRTGDKRCRLVLPIESFEIQERLLQLKDLLAESNWWGILLRIDRRGNCEVTYNYDENCVDSMFDDEDAKLPF